MTTVTNLWEERRIRLSNAAKDAVIALLNHMQADSAMIIDIDPNDPNRIILMGDKESLRHLIDHETMKA